jgi:hypothetical protein
MANAKDLNPKAGGILTGIIGPPKTGKSSFIRSASEVGKVALAVAPVDELDRYAGFDIEYEVFENKGWRPQDGKYTAGAFAQLLKWVDGMTKRDDIKVVAFDRVGNGFSDLAMQEILGPAACDDPMDDAKFPFGRAYGGHARLMKQLRDECLRLTAQKKHVIWSFHSAMKEQEGIGAAKLNTKTNELEFIDRAVPVVHSAAFAQQLPGWFSLWLFTDVSGSEYSLRATPDAARLAGSRLDFADKWPVGMEGAGQPINKARLPNNFRRVLEALK